MKIDKLSKNIKFQNYEEVKNKIISYITSIAQIKKCARKEAAFIQNRYEDFSKNNILKIYCELFIPSYEQLNTFVNGDWSSIINGVESDEYGVFLKSNSDTPECYVVSHDTQFIAQLEKDINKHIEENE